MQPLISVLMAVYEPQPQFLRDALESVLNQSLGDFELIIVEDPSPQPGEEIVKQYRDARIRYVLNETRTSLVEQKNRGLACARGAFVAIMDADDVSEPRRFEKQVAYLRKHPAVDVVGSQVSVINQSGAGLGYRLFPLDHEPIMAAMKRVVPLCHPSVMLRREPLVSVGGYRETGYPIEDYELWSQLAKQQARFANHPDALLRYRVHPGQTKARRLRECIQGVLCVKRQFWRTEMDFGSRLRMWAEQCLLWLPPGVVYQVLLRTEYCRHTLVGVDGDARAQSEGPRLLPHYQAAKCRPAS